MSVMNTVKDENAMAELKFDFCKEQNNRLYSDGSIESEMLSMVKKGSVNWYEDGRWPVAYHFSPLRQNILNWYPFDRDGELLEVGAGCGALTGLFCDRVRHVAALELTEIRSRINYERNKDKNNLDIYVCDIADFKLDKRFDYIIVNGVLEYAALMFRGSDPYVEFLCILKNLLKPDGVILLAIENRIGLKYFAGSKEDYLGTLFSGLSGYEENSTIRTFTHGELENKVKKAGLCIQRDYYPFPDYKFPMEIFTRDTINSMYPSEGSRDYHLDSDWWNLFNRESMQRTLVDENVAECFANSFLLEIGSNGESHTKNISYVKISDNRRRNKCICTIIDQINQRVQKKALYPESREHVSNMLRHQGQHGEFSFIPGRENEGGIEFPLLKGDSLHTQLLQMDHNQKYEEFESVVLQICDKIVRSEPDCEDIDHAAFIRTFGEYPEKGDFHWKKNLNIDIITENIFEYKGVLSVIDYEWCFDFAIPVEYVLWRIVEQLERNCRNTDFNRIYEHLKITKELKQTFQRWNIYFLTQYVGCYDMQKLSKPQGEVHFHTAEQIKELHSKAQRQKDAEEERMKIEEQKQKRIEELEQQIASYRTLVISIKDAEEQINSIAHTLNDLEYVFKHTKEYWKARRRTERGYLSANNLNAKLEIYGVKHYCKLKIKGVFRRLYAIADGKDESSLTRRVLRAGKRTIRALLPKSKRLHFDDAVLKAKYNYTLGMVQTDAAQTVKARPVTALDEMKEDRLPLVSVIVPNYNHEPYLRQRLDSIYNQTYQNFEVLLLDDCSTDNSRGILQEYAQRYSDRTRTIFNDKNVGRVNLQWEKGIANAKGELIWIAESDDYCELDFLEKLLPAFRYESVQMAFARSVFVQNGKQIWTLEDYLHDLKELHWDRPFYETAYNLMHMGFAVKNIIPNASSAVFRNIKKINPQVMQIWKNIRLCGDWLFYVDLIKGGVLYYSNETTNYYRVHEKSTSLSVQKTERYYIEVETISKYIVSHYQVDMSVFDRTREVLYEHYLMNTKKLGSEQRFNELYSLNRIAEEQKRRKPNVMICLYAFLTGGGEVFPIQLANALSEKGVAVTLVNCNYEQTEMRIRNKVYPSVPVVNLTQKIDLQAVVRRFGAEIIHSHHASIDKLIAEYVMPGMQGVKHVVTLHGMYETVKDKHDLKELLTRVTATCDKYVYIADKNLKVFKDNRIYDETQFIKLNNGMFRVDVSPVPRNTLNIPEKAFVLCLVSRGLFAKGWLEAVQIVNQANKASEREIHLILVGNGEAYDQIKKDGYSKFIHPVGIQQCPEQYFRTADMGFLPSRYAGESVPLVIIESLLCGKPVLASNIGEIRNMLTVKKEMAGDIFDLEDGCIPVERVAAMVVDIANNRSRFAQMCALVPEAAERFSIQKIADDYMNVYEQVLERRE